MKEIKIITKDWDKIVPNNIESYRRVGGYSALHNVIRNFSPTEVIEEVKKSRLVGRGGAGFPTGQKWEITAKNSSKEKYFICNLDESEPGTFKDRVIAEKNPHQIIEGIIIGSYAVGARKAFIYLNGGFNIARVMLEQAIQQAYDNNLLGKSVMGADFDLDLEIFFGAGAYICGEESALINSMEGKRGEPRNRPPFPCDCGLFGSPTVVNNGETLANVPFIFKKGAGKFSVIGAIDCPGTKLFCVDGAVNCPGLYEAPIGITVEDIVNDLAGGIKHGLELSFVQIGGASGRLAIASTLGEIPSYSKNAKIPLGSGAILVIDKFQDPREIALSWLRFFQREY
jgi:NADH-quinone oxidoreductase subunit F